MGALVNPLAIILVHDPNKL